MSAHVRLITALSGLLLLSAGLAAPASAESAASAATDPAAPVNFHEWRTSTDFAGGTAEGVAVTPDGLVICHPIGTVQHKESGLKKQDYEYGRWTSPVYPQGFDATQLVASWNANTPAGTYLEVQMRGHTAAGTDTGWYTMGRWAFGDQDIHRTSIPKQSDDNGYVDVDTFVAAGGHALRNYQLRVTLLRAKGSSVTPTLRMIGAMTSNIPDRFTVPISAPGVGRGIELPVPHYSQDLHYGQYPEYDGGGEAWCSPTSTEMVVEYYGHKPSPADLAWVDPSYVDPTVDYAARFTYDYDYKGTGNWPFNAAYAGSFGLHAYVTRLSSLAEAEQFIARGTPIVTSVSFYAAELDGAGYGTSGHLMVIVGFTADGDVIANDPASKDDAAVRHVYKRAQFETIWQRTKRYTAGGDVAGGPGGVAYVISQG